MAGPPEKRGKKAIINIHCNGSPAIIRLYIFYTHPVFCVFIPATSVHRQSPHAQCCVRSEMPEKTDWFFLTFLMMYQYCSGMSIFMISPFTSVS